MPKPKANLIGRVFDKLTVTGLAERTLHGSIWLCECTCGNSILRFTAQLTRLGKKGSTQMGCNSCAMRDRTSGKNGNCIGGKTRLYKIWLGMLDRCRRKTSKSWKWYGAKGVSVCEQWKWFPAFKEWALSHHYADDLTIDRKDAAGNYDPLNCEWVTSSENSRRVHH
jgi:hypothetical protein